MNETAVHKDICGAMSSPVINTLALRACVHGNSCASCF